MFWFYGELVIVSSRIEVRYRRLQLFHEYGYVPTSSEIRGLASINTLSSPLMVDF